TPRRRVQLVAPRPDGQCLENTPGWQGHREAVDEPVDRRLAPGGTRVDDRILVERDAGDADGGDGDLVAAGPQPQPAFERDLGSELQDERPAAPAHREALRLSRLRVPEEEVDEIDGAVGGGTLR